MDEVLLLADEYIKSLRPREGERLVKREYNFKFYEKVTRRSVLCDELV